MSIVRYRGLMLVALWQTAPTPVVFDSTGRVQAVLGFGSGQYEQVRVGCNNENLGTSPVEFRGAGLQIDAWPTRKMRVSGFGGSIRADSTEWDGDYYGAVVALEDQRLGAGLGVMRTPNGGWPSAYLRAGNQDALHLRFDMGAPSPPLHTGGAARIGAGYHLGHLRGLGGMAGLAFCHGRCDGNSNPSAFADLRVPVLSHFDLELRGLIGDGKDYANSGLAVAGRLHFGK